MLTKREISCLVNSWIEDEVIANCKEDVVFVEIPFGKSIIEVTYDVMNSKAEVMIAHRASFHDSPLLEEYIAENIPCFQDEQQKELDRRLGESDGDDLMYQQLEGQFWNLSY